MPNVWFIVSLFVRVLRGERRRKATPGERRTDGASLGLAGLMGLLPLSLDPDAQERPHSGPSAGATRLPPNRGLATRPLVL